MSRLWPESLEIGLFPGHSWIFRSKLFGRVEVQQGEVAGFTSAQTALEILSTLLSQHAADLPKAAKVNLLVSDVLGATFPLAWQSDLHNQEERDRYAALLLKREQPSTLEPHTVCTARYRHFGQRGLAVGMNADWLNALAERLNAHGLTLQRVMPITAHVYDCHPLGRDTAPKCLLLIEERSVVAMTYASGVWCGLDVELTCPSHQQALRRLNSRLDFSSVAEVLVWSPRTNQTEQIAHCLRTELATHNVVMLEPRHWVQQ